MLFSEETPAPAPLSFFLPFAPPSSSFVSSCVYLFIFDAGYRIFWNPISLCAHALSLDTVDSDSYVSSYAWVRCPHGSRLSLSNGHPSVRSVVLPLCQSSRSQIGCRRSSMRLDFDSSTHSGARFRSHAEQRTRRRYIIGCLTLRVVLVRIEQDRKRRQHWHMAQGGLSVTVGRHTSRPRRGGSATTRGILDAHLDAARAACSTVSPATAPPQV